MSIQVAIGPVASLPGLSTNYVALIAHLVGDTPDASGLFAVSHDRLLESNARLVAVHTHEGDLLAGLHVIIDGKGNGILQGVATDPRHRGKRYGRLIVLEALSLLSKCGVPMAELYVRCNDTGIPSPVAFKLYKGCGFSADPTTTPVPISGTELDRHLGPAKSSFLVLRMTIVLHRNSP